MGLNFSAELAGKVLLRLVIIKYCLHIQYIYLKPNSLTTNVMAGQAADSQAGRSQ
jgi:hypothetical protein